MKADITKDETRVQLAVYRPKANMVLDIVSEFTGVPVEDIRNHNKQKEVAEARKYVHYFCRKVMSKSVSLHVIGALTCNGNAFDHSSVGYNIRSITKLYELKTCKGEYVYIKLRENIDVIEEKIKSVKYCDYCGQPILKS